MNLQFEGYSTSRPIPFKVHVGYQPPVTTEITLVESRLSYGLGTYQELGNPNCSRVKINLECLHEIAKMNTPLSVVAKNWIDKTSYLMDGGIEYAYNRAIFEVLKELDWVSANQIFYDIKVLYPYNVEIIN